MDAIGLLARNLSRLRQERGLTITGMAERCGVQKETLIALEDGQGNPTLEVLWAISAVLDVPFGMLVANQTAEFGTESHEFGCAESRVKLLERTNSDPEIEVYSMELLAGYRQKSPPHPRGVRESVTVLSGALLAGDREKPKLVRAGESYSFAADVPHIYAALDKDAKVLSVIEYPSISTLCGTAVINLDWPTVDKDWDGVRSVVDRILIEVTNGISAKIILFHGCGDAIDAARQELLANIVSVRSSHYHWPLFTVADVDIRHGPYFAVLPLRYTSSFCKNRNKDFIGKYDILSTATWLAHLAESPFSVHVENEINDFLGFSAGNSIVLSALASEVLVQRGVLTLPKKILDIKEINYKKGVIKEDRYFSCRIDVDHYDVFELLHPAYARQVVAVAEDIIQFLPLNDIVKSIDVGTGPGMPLLMLHELLPNLNSVAIEPDPVANAYLAENIRGISSISASTVDFLGFEVRDEKISLITSVGASHHFNTAFMLQKAMSIMSPGGILSIADEFLPEFHTVEERNIALIKHHCHYMITAMAWLGEKDIGNMHDADFKLYRTFQKSLSIALIKAELGLEEQAKSRCRDLYAEIKKSDLVKHQNHILGAYARFFWLELQALVAGLDYEVERKTYPGNFVTLANVAGFEIVRHRRVFATVGTNDFGGGTHVFTLRKP